MMRAVSLTLSACALALLPLASAAHTLAQCERITHISHGGVKAHRDLGMGKVMWRAWWSQEGIYTDLHLANCATGETLSLRTHEERIKTRHIADRTDAAERIIARQAATGPFFTLGRVADALKGTGRDLELAQTDTETCACHAAYPDLRGEKTEFEELQ